VLTEVADGMSRPGLRQAFQNLYESLLDDPQVFVEPPDQDLFEQGMTLFAARPDKEWSLTDCISFVVMQRRRIVEALTGDHHFEQAGFAAMLK
jgi:predicted nucleic acid-binding protein